MTIGIGPSPCKVSFPKNWFETASWAAQRTVCGIDEVGRGCLAGPLVAAAVILPLHTTSPLLKDSKELSEKQRLHAYEWIACHATYAWAILHPRAIDQYTIWQTTLFAMQRAIMQLLTRTTTPPAAFLVDAMPLSLHNTAYAAIPVQAAPKGESWSDSIAAASIVAKVERDRIMNLLDLLFPQYALARNKGYGTQQHITGLFNHGSSLMHRTAFVHTVLSKKEVSIGQEIAHGEKQQTLC